MIQYCLKCGASLHQIFEHGFNRYICHACGWTFYNNPRPCVTAVIHQSQNILFIRRAVPPGQGKWDFPGGFMEIGEHPEQALRRELREEIGTTLSSFQQLGFYTDIYNTDEEIPILNIVFLCRIQGDPRKQSEEFDQWAWFPISGLPDHYAFLSMKNIIRDTLILLDNAD